MKLSRENCKAVCLSDKLKKTPKPTTKELGKIMTKKRSIGDCGSPIEQQHAIAKMYSYENTACK